MVLNGDGRLFNLIHKANTADPDQNVASDLGLHCLTMPQMSQTRFYRKPSINSSITSQ